MKPLRPSRSLTLRLNLSRKATLKVGFFICILNPVVQGLNISHPVLISVWCVYLSHHIVFYHRKPYSEVYALSIGFFEWLQNWNRQIKWHSRDLSHILLFQKSEEEFFDGSLSSLITVVSAKVLLICSTIPGCIFLFLEKTLYFILVSKKMPFFYVRFTVRGCLHRDEFHYCTSC